MAWSQEQSWVFTANTDRVELSPIKSAWWRPPWSKWCHHPLLALYSGSFSLNKRKGLGLRLETDRLTDSRKTERWSHMIATWDSFLFLYGLKVSCIRGAGVLRDERRLCVPNVLPVHVVEERVTLEVLNSILPQTQLRVTDQPVNNQRKKVRGSR